MNSMLFAPLRYRNDYNLSGGESSLDLPIKSTICLLFYQSWNSVERFSALASEPKLVIGCDRYSAAPPGFEREILYALGFPIFHK